MKIIRARFRDLEQLREAYHEEFPTGGLFAATTEPLTPGSVIVVELICEQLPNRLMIRGTVQSWRPALPRLRVRAGALVVFAAEEKSKRDFLADVLHGTVQPEKKRRYSRIPVAVPVNYRIRDQRETLSGSLADVSIGGALLRTAVLPAIGSELILSLLPPGGAAPMDIVGRVTHHKPGGGAGIKFAFRDGGGARRLRELIRRFCAS